jgi:hypothetical protein
MLGVLTLGALVLFISGHFLESRNFLGLGPEGMERMIVYPAMLWGIGLGSYMMRVSEPS